MHGLRARGDLVAGFAKAASSTSAMGDDSAVGG